MTAIGSAIERGIESSENLLKDALAIGEKPRTLAESGTLSLDVGELLTEVAGLEGDRLREVVENLDIGVILRDEFVEIVLADYILTYAANRREITLASVVGDLGSSDAEAVGSLLVGDVSGFVGHWG